MISLGHRMCRRQAGEHAGDSPGIQAVDQAQHRRLDLERGAAERRDRIDDDASRLEPSDIPDHAR